MTWFDKIRLYLIYTTAVTLIILAVVFSVLRAVLPHATGYVDDLEQVLTEQTGLPVSIGSMDADMYWLVPRLKLVDVIIYDKGKKRELLHLDEAIFALAFVDSILQRSPAVGDISLVGADLDIERLGNNRWRVQGIDFGADSAAVSDSSASSDLINAVKNISFSLLDSNIHWRDYQLRSGQLDFIGANIFIEEFFGDHSLEINLQLPEIYGESLRLIVKTDDDISHLAMADLDVYLQLSSIDMGQWLSVVDIDGLPTIQGIVNGELWFARKANVFSQVVADASVRQLTVARDNQGTSSLDNAKAKLEWMRTDSGWSFNSRDIVLVKGGAAWPELASVSAVKDNTGLSVFANYLRVQDLLEIANVVVDATTLKSIKNYQLSDIAGDFYNLSAFLPADEKSALSLSTVFENLDFHVPDSEISFRGVDGSLSYIKGQVRLELLSESVAMDFGA
ncbi:MAG: hypothetical protein OEM07_01945, partial [Gammaproteobacteria bacterium]|nr:hypothetical protein [Gammaproteobacteria bacterium]